jgi:outer membrane protein assembly factor BamD (BamD/ComL family)
MKRSALAFIVIALLLSCQSVPTEIPDDLTQVELIQSAQEAADQENWEAAIAYYQAIVDRFPQDRPGTATALYEIAFIHYKTGDTEAAQSEFEQLLGMYDFEANLLPEWPKILAERLLSEIASGDGDETASDES